MGGIGEHDGRKIRCRILGHEVPFHYCRSQPGDPLCRNILNCWWEHFDVAAFLLDHMPEEHRRLMEKQPTSRLGQIMDAVDRAKGELP